MDTILAGASVIDITAPAGFEMAGFGARTGVAVGIHDPLHERAEHFAHASPTPHQLAQLEQNVALRVTQALSGNSVAFFGHL